MPIKEIASYLVHINGRTPEQVANALVKLAELTGGERQRLDVEQAVKEVGQSRFPITSRILSVRFEGRQYVLKIGITEEVCWVSAHSGETPGVGPIKATAELLDWMAGRENKT